MLEEKLGQRSNGVEVEKRAIGRWGEFYFLIGVGGDEVFVNFDF